MGSKYQPSKKLPKDKPRTMEGKATKNTFRTETAKKLSTAKDKVKSAVKTYKKKRLIKKANKTATDL